MIITKAEEIYVTILPDGYLEVRRDIFYLEDGVRVGDPRHHQAAYSPGDSIDHEDKRVKDIGALVWTADVVTAHRDRVAAIARLRDAAAAPVVVDTPLPTQGEAP